MLYFGFLNIFFVPLSKKRDYALSLFINYLFLIYMFLFWRSHILKLFIKFIFQEDTYRVGEKYSHASSIPTIFVCFGPNKVNI